MNLIITFKGCLSSSEKGLKNLDLNGDANPNLCDAGAVLSGQLGAGRCVGRL